jgi:acetyltransferase-like isoleucine patch superfamily enzyme
MKLIERIIRLRSPDFRFDPNVPTGVIVGLAVERGLALVRSAARLAVHWRRPALVFFGRGVRLINARAIRLGRWVQVGDHVLLSALGTEGLEIGNNSSIGAYSRLAVATSYNRIGAFIRIGNDVGIGEFAHVGGAGGVLIGDECIIGSFFSVHPENHNYSDTARSIRHQGVTRRGISVGRNCWIGAKVTICDGVVIGEGSVIAAGAVVTRSMPARSVIGGVPARVLKRIGSDGGGVSAAAKEAESAGANG